MLACLQQELQTSLLADLIKKEESRVAMTSLERPFVPFVGETAKAR